MIANISLSDASFGETQNTLHWADRAKEIRTKVSFNYWQLYNQQTDFEYMNASYVVSYQNMYSPYLLFSLWVYLPLVKDVTKNPMRSHELRP